MHILFSYVVHHFLVYLTGVANTTGRLFAGFIANTRSVSHLNICNIGLIISAVACFLFFLCKTFDALLGFAVAYGFFIGIHFDFTSLLSKMLTITDRFDV